MTNSQCTQGTVGLQTGERDQINVSRLDSVDFLRGVVLTIVLLDHVDFWTDGQGFFRKWTLIGIGFSDAAEAFVFLSGFVFGWTYGPKSLRDSFSSLQKKCLMRALQIYFGYLVTLAIIALPAYWNPHPSYPHPRFEWNTIWAALTLTSQPFAVGILCFYMIVLPFLPTAILDCHQRPRLVIAFSVALYVLVQINSQFNLRSTDGLWQFNPFAWQLLLMFGLIIGFRVRVKGNCIPKSRILTLAALLAVVFAILDRKGFSLLNSNGTTASFWGVNNSQLLDWLTAKTNLGLVRLLHALAVFYLVYRVLPTERGPWLNSIAKPFIVCGRNSLFVYCLGVVLAYFSHLVFAWTGITWLTVLIVPGNACLLQFAIANKWDRSRIRALSCQRKVRSNES